MYPVPTHCPVCNDELHVSRLVCRACGSTLEGRFTMGRLARLTPDQLDFVELFVRSEGKLKWVQDELGLSYPTVRSRLEDVIRALGFEVRQDREEAGADREEILGRLARREITAEDALDLL